MGEGTPPDILPGTGRGTTRRVVEGLRQSLSSPKALPCIAVPAPPPLAGASGPPPRAGEERAVVAVLVDAARRLAGLSATPRLDAELLLAHALGTSREDLLLGRHDGSVPAGFEPLVARRAAGEPLAYIVGRRDFWTIDLHVAPGVLIPRPDSETLIEAALDRFGRAGPSRILDLGTGSGALLLAALAQWPDATGVGVDISPAALGIAAGNADRLGLAGRASFRAGDWGQGIAERFDLLLCNPPYVESDADLPRDVAAHEPAGALFAGPDGLDDYRRLAPQVPRLLAPGGFAAIELGAGQFEPVAALFAGHGLAISVRPDLAGHQRCLTLSAS